jgi:alpha-tubulin suppressor-like RCC1 family protein
MVNWNIILTVIIITIILIILILLTLNYFNKIENFNTVSGRYGFICTYNSNDCTEEDNTLCITEGYRVYACGDNSSGQLGLPSADANDDVIIPLEISRSERISINDLDIKSVFCNKRYSLILTNDNKLFLSGENPMGGDTVASNYDTHSFREILINLNIKTIHFIPMLNGREANHGFFILTEDGKVYSCGYSSRQYLGLGLVSRVYKPTLVSTLSHETVKDISISYSHNLYLTEDGKVYGCGRSICFYNSAIEKYPTLIPLSKFDNKKIVNIHAGYEYSIFVTEEGKLYYCGKTPWRANAAADGIFSSLQLDEKKILNIFSNQTTYNQHCLILTVDGEVYGLGRGGKLFNNQVWVTPTKLQSAVDIKDIVISHHNVHYSWSLFLDNDGDLHSYGTGINSLGDGGITNNSSITPSAKMRRLGKIKNFSATAEANLGASVLVITEESGIYSYGNNHFGNLGTGGNVVSIPEPYLIEFVKKAIPFDNISQISNCGSNTLFLTTDGYVYGCGDNSKGQLGFGNTYKKLSGPEPIPITLEVLTSLSNIKQICCLDRATMVLTDEGRVYACGSNYSWALGGLSTFMDIPGGSSGLPNFIQIPITNVNKICHGSYHCFLMLKDGSIYTWGWNGAGECGVGHKNLCKTPTKLNFEGINNVIDISPGYQHTLFLMNDGTVYTCGSNSSGQLGLGGSFTVPTLIATDNLGNRFDNIKKIFAGRYSSFFINQSDVLYVCGDNSKGQLGKGDTIPVTSPTEVSNFKNVKDVSNGGDDTIFLKSNGDVFCCGANYGGQFGFGNKDQKIIPTKVQIDDVKSIFAGGLRFSLLLKNDNTVYVAGYNNKGQLGLGDVIDKLAFTKFPITDVKTLSAGYDSCLLLKNDGSLYSWGDGTYGKLGLGDFSSITNPALIDFFHNHVEFNNINSISVGLDESFFLKRDGTVFKTVNNFPQVFPMPNDVIIKDVFAGSKVKCCFFLTENGEVYCYGVNSTGQLGLGNVKNYSVPTLIASDNRGNRFDNIKKISCNGNHTLFLKNDGNVYSCGVNSSGQLGLGVVSNIFTPTLISFVNNIKDISTGSTDSYFLTNTGDVYMCGLRERESGFKGETQLSVPVKLNMKNITAISKNYYHEMFLTKYGDVYCTGRNDSGELGLGNLDAIYYPIHVPIYHNINDVYTGPQTTFFLFNKEE